MNQINKRIAAIHSLAGFGKCSLTMILPVLSSAGLEVCPLPTAYLSSHTGGLPGFTYRDLSEELTPAARQWKDLGLKFDGLYSGFLGSLDQIQTVSDIFDLLSSQETKIFVDPCMADRGKLYQTYTMEMAKKVKLLCEKADFILPNLTEAALLLDEPYTPEAYTQEGAAAGLLSRLARRFSCGVVLTGVSFSENLIGAGCLESPGGSPSFVFAKKISQHYHGTGDLFASAFIAGKMKGLSMNDSAQIAADFVSSAIARTAADGTDERFGVNFEAGMKDFLRLLSLKGAL